MPRLVKISDKWGSVLLGTAKVLGDKNGMSVSETAPNDYGVVKLKFKAVGASRQSDKPDANGTFRWRTQRSWFSIYKTDPLAPIVESLDIGDKIWVFGILKKSEYTNPNTGALSRNLFCNLEDIRILAKSDGTRHTNNVTNIDFVDPDGGEFNDFGDGVFI